MHRQSVAAQQKIHLRAGSEAPDDRPLVLFVCVHNAGRSRMAEAFFNDLAPDRFRALSAGTEPAAHPHPEVVRAMRDSGLEIPDTPGRLLTPDLADQAVQVIGMGCSVEEACPALRVPLEDWELDDPKGRSEEEVVVIRDEIELRVRNLIGRLDRAERAGP